MQIFKNILIYAIKNKNIVAKAVKILIPQLELNNYKVFLADESEALTKKLGINNIKKKPKEQDIDLIIAIGGDGTMLRAAQLATLYDAPLLGINCGLVGFLTDVCYQNNTSLLAILSGQYQLEKRMLLQCIITRNNNKEVKYLSLNDVVLSRGGMVRILEFDIYINNKFICNQRADGLIISTPTGSTAYALSAGGPIINPSVNVISIVPMCAHTLNTRPLVISANDRIKIIVKHRADDPAGISCDGQEKFLLEADDIIEVDSLHNTISLLHPKEYDYFETLRTKLHWERKPYANLPTD